MPLALLLNSFIKPLTLGLRRLDPWNIAVRLEELLATRAQSAYLVEWFGSYLPLSGLTVRVAIGNLSALQARYQTVLAEAAQLNAPSASLTEPLAGFAGSVVGLMLTPTGGAILIQLGIIVQDLGPWYVRPLMIAAGVIAIGLFPTLAGLGLLPVAGGIVLGAAPILAAIYAAGNPRMRALLYFLPALARLFEAFSGFLRQIMGPRSGVRNPIVRLALGILDAFAGLLPQVLALFAVLVEGVGPMLAPLARQIVPFFALMRSSFDLIDQIAQKTMASFEEFFGSGGRLMHAYQTILRIVADINWGAIFRPVTFIIIEQGIRLYIRRAVLNVAIETYLDATKTYMGKVVALGSRPFDDVSAMLDDMMPTLLALKKPSAPPAPGTSPSAPLIPPAPPFPSFPPRPRTAILGLLSDFVPSPSDAGVVAGAMPSGLLAFLGMPFAMSAEGLTGIARREATPSIFAGEYRRIVREGGGKSIAEQFAALRDQEMPLRSALTAVVDSILPASVRAQVPALAPLFARLDREVYGLRTPRPAAPASGASAPPLPVLQVDDQDTRLLPVVRRLRIQINNNADYTQDPDEGVRRAARDRTAAWAERLRTALETMPPLNPAVAAGGGG